jgi:hypothetical protein
MVLQTKCPRSGASVKELPTCVTRKPEGHAVDAATQQLGWLINEYHHACKKNPSTPGVSLLYVPHVVFGPEAAHYQNYLGVSST